MSTGTQTNNIDSILTENRVFECSDEFRSKAHIRGMDEYERLYQAAETDPETFWSGIASQLHWFKPWDKVLDWNCPWAKWFSGGETQPALTTASTAMWPAPPQQGRDHVGRRARRSA